MSRWIERLVFVLGVNPPEALVDTSALSRVGHHAGARDALLPAMASGRVAVADPTRLEMGLTARNADDHAQLGRMLAGLPRASITPRDYDRAWEVQGLLAERSQHRGVALPDLLVAAVAERLALTVIHCDADFDRIAEVTGQPMRWAVDPDSL